MAAIATQDPSGGIASVLRGSLHAQAPQRPGPLPSRVLYSDEQLQRNQPFYIPTVQPLFPYQWPMSTPYVPYGGFHGLGYGMMPSLLLPQCLEVPGYMIPQAQLHMLDYRRMTPHVAPTIAHQTRHSHFQNGMPPGRVMVSAEVQTEPLCHSVDSNHHAISHNCSESGRGTGSPLSTSPSCLDNKSVAYAEDASTLPQNFNATNAINTADLYAVPKTEILQAERMQMKSNKMPAELKNFQNEHNTEIASHNETDLLQCSLGSIKSSGDVVLCSYQSLAFRKDKQKIESGMVRYSRQNCRPACTKVTVVRSSPSCRTLKTYPKPSRSVITQSIKEKSNSEMSFHLKSRDDGNSSNNMDFKILRLPFDLQNHNQPCQLEASVWSLESLMPYVPSTEWMTENGLLTPLKPLSPLNEHSGIISKPNYIAEGKNLQPVASAKYQGRPCPLEASIWSVESLMPYVPSNEWMVKNGFLTPQKWLNPQVKPCDVQPKQNQSSTSIQARKKLQTDASNKQNFIESHSPYRPSTSWLADFGNVYYYSKLPVVRQQPDLPEKQLPKMSLAISPESSLRNGKNTNQRPAISSSDLKHCSFSTSKCKAKSSLRLAGSAVKCSWVSRSTLENKLPFCPSCKYETKGKDRRKSFSDRFSCKREEITEENTICMKRSIPGFHCTPKMTSGSRLVKSSAVYQAKLSEQTRMYEDCQCLNPSPVQDKNDLEWRIWKKTEEDWINNPNQRLLRRLQKGNACNASMQVSKNEKEDPERKHTLKR
ncbi:uncharacterized protein buc2l isoform X2 [Puntigrus tetrazona]|uniref:uncharacterized protein buc2l isoform X2 n=1 Tax=Puntigrus tetrazona TaxID=1606681 RepID=UPI001C8AD6ED|nr:uncharacterized protein buc2l isoform X2 [Puntigrus tetrazona]